MRYSFGLCTLEINSRNTFECVRRTRHCEILHHEAFKGKYGRSVALNITSICTVLEQKNCFWKKNNKCKVIYEKINGYFNSPRIMVLIKFLSHIDHFPHQEHKMYLKGLTSRDINLRYRKLCQSFHNLRILKTKPNIWRTVMKPLPSDHVETHMVSCTSYTYCLFISR